MEVWSKVKELGRGSYGCVYLAHSSSGFPLAVKTSTRKDSNTSLEKENRILQRLSGCPQVVKHYGGGFDDVSGGYNLLLEYANGGTLLDLITKYGGKIPEFYVRKYTKVLLEGLNCIHKEGLVHCDLKPENILVFNDESWYDPDGLVKLKIADFGLAKERTDEPGDRRLEFRGTPSYMSPESIEIGLICPSLDIWSLGCVVLEMITGEYAWGRRHNSLALMVKLIEEKTPKIRGRLSEEGRDFLSKCFERNAYKRWSAERLLNHPFIVNEYVGDETTKDDDRVSTLDDEFIDKFLAVAISSSNENQPPRIAYLRKGCVAANTTIRILQQMQQQQHVL